MKAIIVAVLLCLSFNVMAKQPTKEQCTNYAIGVQAMAANRDDGIGFEDLIQEINSIDMVAAGLTDKHENEPMLRWLYTKDAISVYREERMTSPEVIYNNRYRICMGIK